MIMQVAKPTAMMPQVTTATEMMPRVAQAIAKITRVAEQPRCYPDLQRAIAINLQVAEGDCNDSADHKSNCGDAAICESNRNDSRQFARAIAWMSQLAKGDCNEFCESQNVTARVSAHRNCNCNDSLHLQKATMRSILKLTKCNRDEPPANCESD